MISFLEMVQQYPIGYLLFRDMEKVNAEQCVGTSRVR